ncbi:MAG TPA: filamentous hemagglutinin N-terminal domain-containing protein [Acetobacteraceae bacterium]|jgi:filamentous hemagglutinin family protein|nr:filamentous hemagglutinin N-terminal domain-containing protein [Acetobacteraceae bacterium]
MANARRKNEVRLLGVVRRRRSALLMSTALQAGVVLVLTTPAGAQPASGARPTGGTVVAGTAAIIQGTNNTAINQSTQRAAIDWKSFNVGSQQSVTFNQPAPSSVTVNRVTGGDPSQIAGRIDANGQVVLINQSGVTFFKGAQVNTNGLMVSAIGASDQAVKSFVGSNTGKLALDQPGKPNAMVDNRGNITVKQAGLAALVAPRVANSGTITAQLGHVVLAGAKTATLDLYGDGLLALDVTNQVTQTPLDKNGNSATALVTNSGVIIADGGTIQLTARAADGVVQNLVEAGGKIRAATMGGQTGVVALNGVGGSIVVEGQLAAPGIAPGTKGGDIEVATTGNVVVTPTARISASGKAGGGTIALGTNLARARGGPGVMPTVVAANTMIQAGAKISASATGKGDGGKVTVLSTTSTHMAGTINAKGGTFGGNGGFVEVSGDAGFSLTGAIDVSAPQGTIGTILLDPDNLEIINAAPTGGDQDVNLVAGSGTITFAGANTAKNQVSNGEIDLLTGTIILQAKTSIVVDVTTPITLQNNANLVLQTNTGDISVGGGSPITASGTGFIQLDAGLTPASGGKITLASDLTTGAGGSITLQADGGVALNGITVTTPTLDISNITSGGATQTAAGVLAVTTLQSSAGVAGDTTLMAVANAVGTIGAFNVTGGSFSLANTSAVSVPGTLTASNNVFLQTTNAGGIAITGTVTAGAAGIAGFQADKFSITSPGTVTAGTVELAPNSAVAVTLGGAGGLSLSQATLSQIKSTVLRLGAVTVPAGPLTTTSNTISIAGAIDLSAVATTLDLQSTGGVLQTAGTLTNVGTLTGTSTSLDITTGGKNNSIATVGSYAVTGGDFLLTDSSAITVGGVLSATGNVYLQSSNATGITVAAAGKVAVGSGSLASFQADKFAITTGGTVTGGTFEYAPNTPGSNLKLGAGGALASLAGIGTTNAIIGGVTLPVGLPSPGFTITAGAINTVASFDGNALPVALRSAGTIAEAGGAPIVNVATLTGSAIAVKLDQANAISNVGSFSATAGDFLLVDGGVASTLGVSGPLTATNVTLSGAPTLAVTGSIGATGTASLSAATIDLANGAIVTGPTVTLNTVAGGIALTGNAALGQGGDTVDISSAGTVSEAKTSVITADTLQSSGGVSGDVTLPGTANAIANLGNFPAVGNFSLFDNSGLTVIGNVTATTALKQLSLEAPSISIAAGGLAANPTSGLLSLQTDTFANGGAISSATVELAPQTAGRSMTLGAAGGLSLALLSGFTTGNLIIGAVTPPGGARGTTAGAIAVGGAFDTTVVPTVTLDAKGAVTQTAPLIGGSQVFGTAGNYKLLDGNNAFSTLGVTTTGGDIQVADGSPLTLSAISTTGNIYLSSPSMKVTASVSAGGVLGLKTDALAFVAGGLAGATIELAPLTSIAETLGAAAGGLSLLDTAFLTTSNLRIGAVTDPALGLTATATSISVGGNFGTGAIALELDTTGAVTETGAFALTAATLTGNAGAGVILGNANAINTLGSFNVSAGSFTLADSGIAGALGVTGPVTASDVAISAAPTIVVAPTIAVGGSIGAIGTVSLTSGSGGIDLRTGAIVTGATIDLNSAAGGITLNAGALVNGATVDLDGTGGVTAAAGIISATTLLSSGGITGNVTLGGLNNVGTLAGFAVTGGSFSLSDGGSASGLVVTGHVTANTGASNVTLKGVAGGPIVVLGSINAGGIVSLDGSSPSVGVVLNNGAVVTGATIDLNGGGVGIAMNGIASLGSAASVVDLTTTGGGVNEATTSTIVATTLQSTAGTVGTVNLAGIGNNVGTLGTFNAGGASFTLADGGNAGNLSVPGTVTAGSVTITGPGTITASGSILAASAVNLSAGALTLSGKVSDGGAGTTSLVANVGTIGETGTLVAGTLSGSAMGAANLTGANATINQVATVSSFSAAGFTLDDGTSLAVTGTLAGGPGVTVLDAGTLTIALGGTVVAAAVGLTAGNITIPGVVSDGGAGTVSLVANTGTIGETGTLISGTLSGSAVGTANLLGASPTANQVATLSNFSAAGFTLDDGISLTVAGALNGGVSATVLDTGTLTIASGGTVTAAAIGLIAGDITIPGLLSDGGAGTVSLVANTGTIGETGTIVSGTLSGSSVGATNLTGATTTTNQIANLGNFSASAGFTLDDGSSLTVNGTLAGGSSVTVLDNGTLTIGASGSVTAIAVSLTANNITIPGLLTDGGGGTVGLIATTGTIGETGTLVAGTLSGSSAGATSLTGATPTTNQVATLGNFSATGFTLDDGTSLSVTGALAGGPSATVLDRGALTVAAGGTVAATAIGLTAGNIVVPGLITDGGTGTVGLVANVGTINETGTLVSGVLTGSAIGAATFAGTGPTTNQVATVSNFTAAGLTIRDGSSLTLKGTVNGGPSVTVLDNGTLVIGAGSTLTATAISLTANNIGILGDVTDGGSGTVDLVASTGTISETGTLVAGTLSGSSLGATSLTGATPTTNQVATLGDFTSSGFTLDNGRALAINGTLNGGPGVTLLDAGGVAIGGMVTATAIGLTGASIDIPGVVTDGGSGSVSLIATAGSIGETGALIAGTLTGSAAATANLAGSTPTSNQVATLGSFKAAGFALRDGNALSVSDKLAGGPSATITDAAALTVGGSVTATAIGLTATSISIPGVVSDGGTGTTNLTATAGAISETGTIVSGTLSGGSTGTTSLTGVNQIATLGNFSAPGLTVADGTNLAINGNVVGGPSANIAVNGSLAINGSLNASTIAITANGGAISEPGALVTTLLNAGATGDANFAGGGNQVATLGNVTSGGTLTLNDTTNLLLSGTLTAPKIAINAGSNTITFANGATIATSGTTRPAGASTNYPTVTTSTTGAFLASGAFTQQGNSFVTGIGGGPSILRIDATGAGNISFDQVGGLHGPSTWLILGIDTGTATGNVAVQNLDIVRTGATGATTLTGSVGGLSGPAAAGVAGIQPSPNSNFRFNSCPIHSVNCVLLPTQGLPTANPLNDITIGSLFNPDDQDDLLLPIVSDQDY